MEKIKNFFKKFSKKKETKNKVLFKTEIQKRPFKKRRSFWLNLKLKKPEFLLNKNYAPYLFGTFFCLFIIILFVIFWPIFRLEQINVTKKDSFTNIDIIYKSLDDFRWDSIFDMEKSVILKRMQEYQENIKDIELKINFPKTINIKAESYKEKFNISINEKNYILLENGSLIPTINPLKQLPNLEIVKNIDKTRHLEYKKIFDMNKIAKIEILEKKIYENVAGIEINELKYYEEEREAHFILNKTTRLIFSLDDSISIEEQIKNISIIDKEKSAIAKNDKVYIDLRISWKVYICTMEWDNRNQKKAVCDRNLESIYSKL